MTAAEYITHKRYTQALQCTRLVFKTSVCLLGDESHLLLLSNADARTFQHSVLVAMTEQKMYVAYTFCFEDRYLPFSPL